MATKAEVRDRVLVELGKLALGQTATNDQQNDISDAIDEVYADLKADGLTTWASTGNIPTEVVPHVVALTAFNRSNGVSRDRYQRIVSKAGIAKREIRRIIANDYVSDEGPTDF